MAWTKKLNEETGELTTQPTGIATSAVCPREGYVTLRTRADRVYRISTRCKTWSCKECRDRNLALVTNRLKYGMSVLKDSYFITVTLRLAYGEIPRDAQYVRTVWHRYLQNLRRFYLPNEKFAWMKVVETTKRGQPHIHFVMGNIGTWTNENLTEMMMQAWYEVTGDSYQVDASRVLSGEKVANYIAKYVVKGMYERDVLDSLGFKRRWTRSRNWPNSDLRLVGLTNEKLKADSFSYGKADFTDLRPGEVALPVNHEYLGYTGTESAVAYADERNKKLKAAALKRMAKKVKVNIGY